MRFRRKLDALDRRRTIPEKIFFVVMFVVMLAWSTIMLSMLVWASYSSLKSNLQYVNEPVALPTEIHFENYKTAMKKMAYNGVEFGGMLYNSLWRSVLPSIIYPTMVMIIGYIVAMYDFKGKNIIFGVVLFTMTLPIYGNFAAGYKLNYTLKFNNSYRWLLASFGGLGSDMLLSYGLYKGMSKTLKEAVYIDGGSDFVALTKVFLPLGRNVFVVFFINNFIAHWNDFNTGLLYFDQMPDLALGLYKFQQEIQFAANNPAYFAGVLMVMLPVLLMFIFGANKIMGSLVVGSVKG